MSSPLTTPITLLLKQKHGKLSLSSLLSPPLSPEETKALPQAALRAVRQAAWASGAVTCRGGEEVGQECAGPRTSCFCSERQSAFSKRMNKSQVLQLLPSSPVFPVTRAQEDAPEKHPGAVEAAGDVGSPTPSGEAAQGTQA